MITYVAALTDDIVTTVSPLSSVAATMEAYCLSELAAAAEIHINVLDKYAAAISVPLSANRDKICEALRAMWEEKKL